MGTVGKLVVMLGTLLLIILSRGGHAAIVLLFPLVAGVVAGTSKSLLPGSRLASISLTSWLLWPAILAATGDRMAVFIPLILRTLGLMMAVGLVRSNLSLKELSSIGGGQLGFVLGVGMNTLDVIKRTAHTVWLSLRRRARWGQILTNPSLMLTALSCVIAGLLGHAETVVVAAQTRGYPRKARDRVVVTGADLAVSGWFVVCLLAMVLWRP